MKNCKKCGAEIAKNAKTCPKCGANFGLPWFVKVLIIIVVIFGCVISCMASCTKGVADSVNDAIEETDNEYKDINGKSEFVKGESFENKHFKLNVKDINFNWKDYDVYTKPDDDKKIVKISLEAENIGNDSSDISSLYFKCYADDVVVDEYIFSKDFGEFGGTISASKKTIGALYYQVPTNAKEIILEYEPNLLDSSYQVKFKLN